jgi:hypothetical protein
MLTLADLKDGKFNWETRTNFFFPSNSEAFPLKVTLRSRAHGELIERTWRETGPELDKEML